MTRPDVLLRRRIMAAFADTGAPPPISEAERPLLAALAEQHIVVLDDAGEIRMAHPFAAHTEGASVQAGGWTWWGNCAWDAFGIAAALGLRDAVVDDHGVRPAPGVVFHVLVPAARWWEDPAFT